MDLSDHILFLLKFCIPCFGSANVSRASILRGIHQSAHGLHLVCHLPRHFHLLWLGTRGRHSLGVWAACEVPDLMCRTQGGPGWAGPGFASESWVCQWLRQLVPASPPPSCTCACLAVFISQGPPLCSIDLRKILTSCLFIVPMSVSHVSQEVLLATSPAALAQGHLLESRSEGFCLLHPPRNDSIKLTMTPPYPGSLRGPGNRGHHQLSQTSGLPHKPTKLLFWRERK